MSEAIESDVELVQKRFVDAGIMVVDVAARQFPGEVIIVVQVPESEYQKAIELANRLDKEMKSGFIAVKKVAAPLGSARRSSVESINDARVTTLIELLNARSRTSEQQPSLTYIKDASETLNVAISRRHHLIFGRRGVGKTALMLEAKRLLIEKGAATFWMNIQSVRSLNAVKAFLTTASRFCEIPDSIHQSRGQQPASVKKADELKRTIHTLLSSSTVSAESVGLLLPELQRMFALLCAEAQLDLYLFFDDIHYLAMRELPFYLDMIHSVTRDISVWIKAAGIKHQSRWFMENPPTGLQTGHDAAIINLDVTLEEPAKAKTFLLSILRTYIDEAHIGNLSGVVTSSAVDRLVLASGGVPRDFLVLSATAVQVARQRAKARSTGVQDVNEAAGRTAQIKLQELEEDAASAVGRAQSRVDILNRLRQFLLEEQQATYFRIDFRDKEQHPGEYTLLQSLMDLRLVHLIYSSLSDEHHAGRRSEVYMLDLSQFSGSRFKHNLRVLDFTKHYLVLKNTGSTKLPRLGDTSKKLQGILRRAPLFSLQDFRDIAARTA